MCYNRRQESTGSDSGYWTNDEEMAEARRRAAVIEPLDLEATRATVARTLEYSNLRERRDRLAAKLEEAGQALNRLAVIYRW